MHRKDLRHINVAAYLDHRMILLMERVIQMLSHKGNRLWHAGEPSTLDLTP